MFRKSRFVVVVIVLLVVVAMVVVVAVVVIVVVVVVIVVSVVSIVRVFNRVELVCKGYLSQLLQFLFRIGLFGGHQS